MDTAAITLLLVGMEALAVVEVGRAEYQEQAAPIRHRGKATQAGLIQGQAMQILAEAVVLVLLASKVLRALVLADVVVLVFFHLLQELLLSVVVAVAVVWKMFLFHNQLQAAAVVQVGTALRAIMQPEQLTLVVVVVVVGTPLMWAKQAEAAL